VASTFFVVQVVVRQKFLISNPFRDVIQCDDDFKRRGGAGQTTIPDNFFLVENQALLTPHSPYQHNYSKKWLSVQQHNVH
jgi:hypothetical protein